MAVRIQLRRDTAANWVANNPTLREGELGIETDTLKIKVGTGAAWNSTINYANVVPSDFNTTLGDYVLVDDIGGAGGVVGLDNDKNAIVTGSSIIIEGSTDNNNETTLTVTNPTADRTITFPDASGTVSLTSDLNSYAALSGATFTGNINVPTAITFEGATADSYETTIQATDPTADRTITIPDATGTLALTTDIPSLSIAQVNTGGTATETYNNITTLQFDEDSGFDVTNPSSGVAKVAMNSTFKYWEVDGVQKLTAIGLDTVNFVSGTGIDITANGLADPQSISIAVDTTAIQAKVADVSDTEIGYLNGVTSAIQTQIDGKISASSTDTLTNKTLTSPKINENVALTATSTELNYVDGVTSAIQTQIDNKAPINNPTFTGTVTLPGAPGSANEAATKAYVDNITAGLNFHAAVHVATIAKLTATYNNTTKTLSASGTFPTIDGETITETQRILVKNQQDAKENGIYELTDDGDPSGSWILTRTSDADNTPSGEIAYGDFVFVQTGATNGGYGFTMTTTGTITLGSSDINWTQFNAGQAVVAGNGLTETSPGTIAINTSITADLSTAQTLTNKTISGSDNTFSNIENSSLKNSSITINGTSVSLGGTRTLGTDDISEGSTNKYFSNELAQDAIGNSLGSGLSYNDSTGAISVDTATIQARVSGVSDTEIGYLDGVTSAIQTQLDAKIAKSLVDAKGDILVASADNTVDRLGVGTNGYVLTANSSATNGVEWAAAAVTYSAPTIGSTEITSGSTVTSISGLTLKNTSSTSITQNTATTVDTNALSAFTTVKYVVSIKQGSKIRSSEIIAQTDGTSVDYTEFGIVETGGKMTGIVPEVVVSSSNAIFRVTITDASATNATVKIQKVLI